MKRALDDETAEDILVVVGSVLVGSCTYMVSIVVTIRVLNSSPLDGSALRRNHSNLGTFLQNPTIEETGRDTEWSARADVDGLHLFDKVHGFNRLFLFVKVSGIINELFRSGKRNKKVREMRDSSTPLTTFKKPRFHQTSYLQCQQVLQ